MSTTQVLIVSLAALLAVALVVVTRYYTRAAELALEDSRGERAAASRVAELSTELEQRRAEADASGPAGPAEGTKVAIHVTGRDVQGTRVRVGEPAADGWIVLDDAAFVTGDRTQPLGGRQWFREGPGMWIQEL